MKPQRVISPARGWEYFANDYLWTVFPRVLLWKTLLKQGDESDVIVISKERDLLQYNITDSVE